MKESEGLVMVPGTGDIAFYLHTVLADFASVVLWEFSNMVRLEGFEIHRAALTDSLLYGRLPSLSLGPPSLRRKNNPASPPLSPSSLTSPTPNLPSHPTPLRPRQSRLTLSNPSTSRISVSPLRPSLGRRSAFGEGASPAIRRAFSTATASKPIWRCSLESYPHCRQGLSSSISGRGRRSRAGRRS